MNRFETIRARLRRGISPGVEQDIAALARSVDDVRARLSTLAGPGSDGADDVRSRWTTLAELARLLPGEPVYGLAGIAADEGGAHAERCRAIARALDPLHGRRVLVVECGLGYAAHAFAALGAHVTGWDSRPDAIAAATLIGDMIGSPARFRLRDEPAPSHPSHPGEFDVLVWFSATGSPSPSDPSDLEALLRLAPTVFIDAPIDGVLPSGVPSAELVDGTGDVPALAPASGRRTLVRLERQNVVTVGATSYPFVRSASESFRDSVTADLEEVRRRYYWGDEVFIKTYSFARENSNRRELINELAALTSLEEETSAHFPRIVDCELNADEGTIVFAHIPGTPLSELGGRLSQSRAVRLARELLETMVVLARHSLWHNDLRSWNVLVTEDRFRLIDYGLAGPRALEDNGIALLWTLHTALTGVRETAVYGRTVLPSPEPFRDTLAQLYAAISGGERDPQTLLDLVAAQPTTPSLTRV